MFDFVGRKRWFLLASAVIIVVGIISLALPGGLKLGIDFKEGSSMTINFQEQVSSDQLRQVLSDLGYEARVQSIPESGDFVIRTHLLTIEEENALKGDLAEELGEFEVEASGRVTAIIAGETVRNAGIAVGVAAIAILLYITWAFRRMPNPFRYGTCAIIALIHDVLIVLGVFSLLGRAFDWEIDPMFVTACLAVIGYSVNNTIVVFDRIRENLIRGISPEFTITVNSSLTQTLGRSLNTSITTILVVLAIYLFVGGTVRNFTLALLVGIIAGTYSSIFIAGLLVVIWGEGKWRRFVPRLPLLVRLRA
jgi:preprotein translocase subunit SecF